MQTESGGEATSRRRTIAETTMGELEIRERLLPIFNMMDADGSGTLEGGAARGRGARQDRT